MKAPEYRSLTKSFCSCSALLGVGEGYGEGGREEGGRDVLSHQTKDIKTQSNHHKEANWEPTELKKDISLFLNSW